MTVGSMGTPGTDPNVPDLDPDAQLVDSADEVWGLVLWHRLPISLSVVHPMPSLASGFLFRRGTAAAEGAEEPIVLGVNVVTMGGRDPTGGAGNGNGKGGSAWKKQSPKSEAILKEVMGQYRGLLTLAQHKSVEVAQEGKRGSLLPWHVAVVEKAIDGLERCM